MIHLKHHREIPFPISNSIFLLSVFCLLFASQAIVGQEKTATFYIDPASTPADLPVTLQHLTALVSFIPESNTVNGQAEFTFTWNRPQSAAQHDSMVFHTPGFTIHSVTLDSHQVTYRQSGPNLIIYPTPRPPSVHPSSALRPPSVRPSSASRPPSVRPSSAFRPPHLLHRHPRRRLHLLHRLASR